MIACHCHVVTDREIMDHIVDGASEVEAVGARCGAGTSCGGCHRTLERLLDAVRSVDAVFAADEQAHASPVVG